jgi:hypothetical protein
VGDDKRTNKDEQKTNKKIRKKRKFKRKFLKNSREIPFSRVENSPMTYLTTHNNRWRDHKVIIRGGGCCCWGGNNWKLERSKRLFFFNFVSKKGEKIKEATCCRATGLVLGRYNTDQIIDDPRPTGSLLVRVSQRPRLGFD